MDFTISEKLQQMVQTIREFMRQDVYPLESEFSEKRFRDLLPVLSAKRRKSFKHLDSATVATNPNGAPIWPPVPPRISSSSPRRDFSFLIATN